MKNLKNKLTTSFFALFVLTLSVVIISCNQSTDQLPITERITESEIKKIQNELSLSLIGIGNAYKNEGDYKATAVRHIERFYGFDDGKVLYKPYRTMNKPFRTTAEGALSYLIGDNAAFPEDEGFAIQPWIRIRWENAGIINDSNIAIAMGTAYFEHENGSETRKNYTLCFKRNPQGDLKIITQKTSSPCE